MRATVASLVVVTFALASCADAPAREKLTVLVEADRARALEDQARIADMQRSLDDAKHDLVDLRERLLRAGAITADENKRLEERESKLAATAAPASSTPSLSKADVETLL